MVKKLFAVTLLSFCVFAQGCTGKAGKETGSSGIVRDLQEPLAAMGESVQNDMLPPDDITGFPGEFVVESGVLVRYEGTGKEVVVPEGVSVIGERAFADNSEITSVRLPEGVTEIRGFAFYCCNKLKEVTLPETLEIIGDYAFSRCFNLESIDLHMVKILRTCAFAQCGKLKKVDLASAEELGIEAFMHSGLVEITGLEKAKSVGQSTFKDTLFYERIAAECRELYTQGSVLFFWPQAEGIVEIPQGINVIMESAFAGNDRITRVIFPDTLTEIGNGAFYGCDQLDKVYIPDSVERIGGEAFSYCRSLCELRLPQYIEKIPEGCFCACSLKEVTIPQNCVMEWGAFYFCGGLKMTLPPAAGDLDYILRHVDDESFDREEYCLYTTDLSEENPLVKEAEKDGWRLEALQLVRTGLTLHVGEDYVLRFNSGADADWSLSDDTVLRLGAGEGFCDRRVTALKEGTAVITAVVYGKEYTCTVEVVPEAAPGTDSEAVPEAGSEVFSKVGLETERHAFLLRDDLVFAVDVPENWRYLLTPVDDYDYYEDTDYHEQHFRYVTFVGVGEKDKDGEDNFFELTVFRGKGGLGGSDRVCEPFTFRDGTAGQWEYYIRESEPHYGTGGIVPFYTGCVYGLGGEYHIGLSMLGGEFDTNEKIITDFLASASSRDFDLKSDTGKDILEREFITLHIWNKSIRMSLQVPEGVEIKAEGDGCAIYFDADNFFKVYPDNGGGILERTGDHHYYLNVEDFEEMVYEIPSDRGYDYYFPNQYLMIMNVDRQETKLQECVKRIVQSMRFE